MKLINTSKVSTDNKITIIKDVADKLRISKGDLIGLYEDNGSIVLKKVIISTE